MPQRPGVRQKARKNKREDIIKASMRVFCEYGFGETTLEKISKEAGTSKSLIVKYFGNTRHLAVLCLDRFLLELANLFRQPAEESGLAAGDHDELIFELIRERRREIGFLITTLLIPAHGDILQAVRPAFTDLLQIIGSQSPGDLDPSRATSHCYTKLALLAAYVIGGSEACFQTAWDIMMPQYCGTQAK